MNHSKERQIPFVASLLQDQLDGLTLVSLKNMVEGSTGEAIIHKLVLSPQNLIPSTPITITFELHLSQVLDRSNLNPSAQNWFKGTKKCF